MAFVYSCCFWFSLRLGGILIGIFSIVHAIIVLGISCVAYTQPEHVKQQINELMKNMKLIYITSFLESFKEDPEKYLTGCISLLFIYITLCTVYIYGAFKCNNTLMIGFIFMELLRLIILSIFVVIWLLILKKNTMDIGLVIGASVASGFVLLGMFYLWICAANLPILINEMEREEQLATITKMQKLLESKKARYKDNFSLGNTDDVYRRDLFVIPRNNFTKPNKGHWNYQNYSLFFCLVHLMIVCKMWTIANTCVDCRGIGRKGARLAFFFLTLRIISIIVTTPYMPVFLRDCHNPGRSSLHTGYSQ